MSELYNPPDSKVFGAFYVMFQMDELMQDGEAYIPPDQKVFTAFCVMFQMHKLMQDGELYNPPDQKVFKPFFMKQGGARQVQLYDVDGPSPRDLPVCMHCFVVFVSACA